MRLDSEVFKSLLPQSPAAILYRLALSPSSVSLLRKSDKGNVVVDWLSGGMDNSVYADFLWPSGKMHKVGK